MNADDSLLKSLLLVVETKNDVLAAEKLGLEATCDNKQHGLGRFLFRSVIVITRAGMKRLKLPGASSLADWVEHDETQEKFLDLVASAPIWEPPESSDGRKVIPFPSGHLGRNDDDDDDILAGRSEEELKSEYPHWPYVVQNGRMYFAIDKKYSIELVRLSNFYAWITEEISGDDGTGNATLAFRVAGTLDRGTPLPNITVPAASFNSLGWIQQRWGSEPIIAAGGGLRDKLREAIQVFSNATRRTIYTHTGWRKINGSSRYLTSNGAIGAHGFDASVEVDLGGGLSRYRLPTTVEDPGAAMAASLSLLDLAPLRITAPLWAAMYRAPLATALPPDLTQWLEGKTGQFKSTISALFLCHFGDFDATHLPASWKSTVHSLEKMAFILKDAPLVIDDYAPTYLDASELASNASYLVRAQGNLAGRGRLHSNLEQRQSFDPRGIILATGEQHPAAPGQSLLARMLITDVAPGAIDKEKLTLAQNRKHLLGEAMFGYLQWIAGKMDTDMDAIRQEALGIFSSTRIRAVKETGHLRIPEMLGHLDLGIFFALQYAEEIGAATNAEAVKRRQECWTAFVELGREQNRLIESERPSERFIRVLHALVGQGRLEIAPSVAAVKQKKSIVVGWHSGGLVYLPAEQTFAEIAKFCRSQGEPFSVSRTRIYKELAADRLLEHDRDRATKAVAFRGHTIRCLALRRDAAEKLLGMQLYPR